MNETERFSKDPMARTIFQKEDKMKKIMLGKNREDEIRMHRESIQRKIETEETQRDFNTESKRKAKQLRAYLYEQVIILFDWFVLTNSFAFSLECTSEEQFILTLANKFWSIYLYKCIKSVNQVNFYCTDCGL